MGSVTKQAWIKIYNDLQKTASRFPQYYYREFFKRRVRDHFGVVVSEGNNPLPGLDRYKKAEELLTTLKRQATLSESLPAPKLVIEQEPVKSLH